MYKQVALIILDGWGQSQRNYGNALKCVPTPNIDALMQKYPSATLQCAGEAVGLMPGQMGDSNVGHLNMGAGRVVFQDLVRVTKALGEDYLSSSPVWQSLVLGTLARGGRLHLFGLLSDGGVHSHIGHLKTILAYCLAVNLEVYLHLQLDGRDVPPTSGVGFLQEIEAYLALYNSAHIATVMGRYYGMDRDQRWERTAQAFAAMVAGEGKVVEQASRAVEELYAEGITDEFIPPLVVDAAQPAARVKDGDGLLVFNFRADRVRQIVQSFDPSYEVGFTRPIVPAVAITTLTRYHDLFKYPYIFAPQDLSSTLGEVISQAGLKQMRMAETEKYAHVTFFFNGGRDKAFPAEDRVLIPSPKVATYDLEPKMSALELTDTFIGKTSEGYNFIVLNYANLDMVGHTGVYAAACQAVATVDACLGRAVQAVLSSGGAAVITSDHGNAEQMLDDSGEPYTAHTLSDVACIIAAPGKNLAVRKTGVLADIAPTVLELLGLTQPEAMTGHSLITGGLK